MKHTIDFKAQALAQIGLVKLYLALGQRDLAREAYLAAERLADLVPFPLDYLAVAVKLQHLERHVFLPYLSE